MSDAFHVGPGASPQRVAAALLAAAGTLEQGGLVVVPTDTCYGLAARADRGKAIESLSRLKARPADKPVAVLVARRRDVWRWGRSCTLARELVRRFLPGPLTVVLEPNSEAEARPLGAADAVGVRVASHPVTRLLCCLSGVGLAATSANLSGNPPPASADSTPREWRTLTSLVVLDGGRVPAVGESTVVDARGGRLRVLREGLIRESDLVV